MLIDQLYQIYKEFPKVCTDTRQISKDCLFFALKGDNFNGNSFADQALEAGAKYVVLDDPEFYKEDPAYILVEDVLSSLQDLARFHRKHLKMPFIGITGTNGKTTSKELLNSVLSQKYHTYATKGNLNNHIGVPLTILSLTEDIEIAIVEMGANHVHEIEFLCGISNPTHGFITNVGKAHLEGFGSFEGVMQAKGELYDYLNANQGQIYIQGDNEYLLQMAANRNLKDVIYYGFTEKNQIQGGLVVADPFLTIFWKNKDDAARQEVKTNLTGAYNIENMLAAVALGKTFGLSTEQINAGLGNYVPQNNRSQISKTDKNTIIADYYNANASSMAAALGNLDVIQADRKVAILGDMFEMGDQSEVEHRKVIEKAKSLNLDRLIFVGKAFYAQRDDQASYFESTDALKEDLVENPLDDYLILLKASRGMAFEKLMEVL
ncbi:MULTISPECIES: UDP-N-acetylmuramoyl-tripeptide--D-alanyl-D-alanine ligase [Sphingobacterium]|uniref:UDP-N-acetylmuramoyl-tripeptide--D-alanyl-D-alanine ligase n=1 Tax=Sphingobacterium cellulitidis TaxID=1768011 RepID=A0A8H9FWA5_9SPHI|nr:MULTISPECIES: UDP-N-acetylmuramoyl-tripeptide--D-alanyl-D-alanine ligase [Sphingobacterium]MBA8985357.1 UDP-N-acetylmuramoyl-tripeptide--D-alanyl-D-alanine ligase [Sphingobacterium soli]WFB63779.1 UDP-N-acetylmuramoyl-tripeptide--D-alanyl-D-alanine ligase [Sphingobacterium sp. WM]GGE10309.1 UDP-N-acetylmuramoyl-tripeptide--D-alanyl-D-alanine ligase [Sphingobacterium soli]